MSRKPTAAGGKAVVKELVEEFLRRLEGALAKAKERGGDSTFQAPETEV